MQIIVQKLLVYSRLVGIWMGNFNPNTYWENQAQKNPFLGKTWDLEIPILEIKWEVSIPMLGKNWPKNNPFLGKTGDSKNPLLRIKSDFRNP